MNVTFQIVTYGSPEWEEAVRLREDVLRKPLLGSRFTPEELAAEKDHHHISGYANGQLVATAVLVPEDSRMKMQRVAVVAELRSQGIGADLLVYCEAFTQQQGGTLLYCHARDKAVDFYAANGYLQEGDYFLEDGIPHLKMYKRLVTS